MSQQSIQLAIERMPRRHRQTCRGDEKLGLLVLLFAHGHKVTVLLSTFRPLTPPTIPCLSRALFQRAVRRSRRHFSPPYLKTAKAANLSRGTRPMPQTSFSTTAFTTPKQKRGRSQSRST